MQLFEKWQRATETYDSFYEESEHLGLEVATFLKHFSEANDTLNNAILKMFDSESERFSILVKTAESVEDYPLVFKFKNDSNGEIWEFIVRDKQEENKTMREYLKSIQYEDKDHSLIKQIEHAGGCRSFMKQNAEKAGVSSDAMLIVDYLIVELLKCGGFDD
ncbi:hypothetical protein ACLF9O_07835 [Helicobacter pylori]